MKLRLNLDVLNRLPKLPAKYRRIVRWVVYPLAYVAAFLFFCYVTFPYDRLKQRVVAGYNGDQKGPDAGHMEIDSLEWSWRFPGIRAQGVRLVGPPNPAHESATSAKPDAQESSSAGAESGEGKTEGAPAAEGGRRDGRSVITVDDVYARISPLSYLFGTTELTFGGDAFGGSIAGSYSQSEEALEVHVELDEVEPSQLPELEKTVGLPLSGVLTSRVDLQLPEGKASKAEGAIELTIEDFRVGDGKAKIRNTLALPQLEVGVLTLEATVTSGQVQIDTLTADGVDVRVDSGGKVKLRDALLTSIVDLTLSFRFTDKYKTKNDITKSLFGEPGSKAPGLFDLDPQIKRAKGTEGDYTWRISGPVNRLRFTPAKGARITKGGSIAREPAAEAVASPKTTKTRPKVKRPKKERRKPAAAVPAAPPPPAPVAATPPVALSPAAARAPAQARAPIARRPSAPAAEPEEAEEAEEEEESSAEEEEEQEEEEESESEEEEAEESSSDDGEEESPAAESAEEADDEDDAEDE